MMKDEGHAAGARSGSGWVVLPRARISEGLHDLARFGARHVDASLDLFTRKSPRISRDLSEKRALSARRFILWMVGV